MPEHAVQQQPEHMRALERRNQELERELRAARAQNNQDSDESDGALTPPKPRVHT